MICPKCGSENPPYSYFCGSCGADLQRPPPDEVYDPRKKEASEEVSIICPSCGADNPGYLYYCGDCGASLKPGRDEERTVEKAPEPKSVVPKKYVPPEPAKPQTVPTKPLPPQQSIEMILRKNSLRIQERFASRPWGIRSFLNGKLWKNGGVIEFKSDVETVSLRIDNDGTISVVKGKYTNPDLALSGPQASFLDMFPQGQYAGKLGKGIEVRFGQVEMMSSEEAKYTYGSMVNDLLCWLFGAKRSSEASYTPYSYELSDESEDLEE